MAQLYPTKPLDCWAKAKELRAKYYEDYAAAEEKGLIRWGGSAWAMDAIPAGLGDDVVNITGEPYGASASYNRDFSVQCMEACEAKGWARDLCSYMRNYLGSILIDKNVFGGKFPKPTFNFTSHICCSHAKWYQNASELEGVPFYAIDVSVGPYRDLTASRLKYVVDQMHEAIEWMEKVTGRKYDDEKLIQAVNNECRTTSLWAEVCTLNKAIPAPLDEKSMYSLYVLGTLMKHDKEVADFHEILRDEVKERVAQGIAAVATERCRFITDTQPPWAFLKIFRYMEKFGAISVGSLYTFGLIGTWDDQEDGSWGPAKTPAQRGIVMRTRDDALRILADWNLRKPEWQHFYDPQIKTDMMIRIAREWKLQGILLHYNRGCEGLSLGIAENRLGLIKAGYPVLAFEGNMGDEREFDEVRTMARIAAFMESLGLKKVVD